MNTRFNEFNNDKYLLYFFLNLYFKVCIYYLLNNIIINKYLTNYYIIFFLKKSEILKFDMYNYIVKVIIEVT